MAGNTLAIAQELEQALIAAESKLAKVEAETIERCATAITLKAREMGRQECCGNGMSCGDHEECCENPNLMISEDEACGVIRALTSKPDQPAQDIRVDPTVPNGEVHFVQNGKVVGKIVNFGEPDQPADQKKEGK